MNQMGKVPLLTREQEVEICKKIEEAEIAMKRIVYGLGFTAKEHIAIAEKLLSEPPKERFDRVIVDKKIANREGHLRDLRKLIKKVRTLDQKVDAKYFNWQKALQKGRKEKLATGIEKNRREVAGNVSEIFLQAKSRRGNDRRGGQRPRKIPGEPAALQDLEGSAHHR